MAASAAELTDADAGRAAAPARGSAPGAGLAWLLIVVGAIGALCSAIILVEKLNLAEDPSYTTSCDINTLVSCADVMQSPQASVFGFPNPILGLVGFPLVGMIGAAVLAGGRFAGWFWAAATGGLMLATLFCHWLMYHALFTIRALCPYCMVVWVCSLLGFVYVAAYGLKEYGSGGAVERGIYRWRHAIAAAWLAAIAVLIVVAFRDYLG